MKVSIALILASACYVFAGCPMAAMRNLKRQIPTVPPLSQNEGNSGPIDSLTFSATDQYVDVSPNSGHAFQIPGASDKRGPCPGLNAAANHGFIPRNGLLNIQQSTCRTLIIVDPGLTIVSCIRFICSIWLGARVCRSSRSHRHRSYWRSNLTAVVHRWSIFRTTFEWAAVYPGRHILLS